MDYNQTTPHKSLQGFLQILFLEIFSKICSQSSEIQIKNILIYLENLTGFLFRFFQRGFQKAFQGFLQTFCKKNFFRDYFENGLHQFLQNLLQEFIQIFTLKYFQKMFHGLLQKFFEDFLWNFLKTILQMFFKNFSKDSMRKLSIDFLSNCSMGALRKIIIQPFGYPSSFFLKIFHGFNHIFLQKLPKKIFLGIFKKFSKENSSWYFFFFTNLSGFLHVFSWITVKPSSDLFEEFLKEFLHKFYREFLSKLFRKLIKKISNEFRQTFVSASYQKLSMASIKTFYYFLHKLLKDLF